MPQNELDWTHVRSFLATIESGSLSGAARTLGLTQPTLGRHIQELEDTLGTKLFRRYQKGLEPTEAGRRLVDTARLMRSAADSFELEARGTPPAIHGTLRIAASGLLAAELGAHAAQILTGRATGLSVELATMPAAGMPAPREADIAIVSDRPINTELDFRRLGSFPVGLYGHDGYWARHGGRPASLDQLNLGDIIGPDRLVDGLRSLAAAGLPVLRDDCRVRTDDPMTLLAAVNAGAGLGLLPIVVADRVAGLSRVELPLRLAPLELWAVNHGSARNDRRRANIIDLGLSALLDAAAALSGSATGKPVDASAA